MYKSLVFLSYFLYVWCSCNGAVYTPAGGPVYVNPDQAAAQSIAVQQQQIEAVELLTQTVYGFLDFTTTIGNTVMVFSPQSAPADGEKKSTESTSSVIETKPSKPSSVTSSTLEIKPSKTTGKTTEKKSLTSSPANPSSSKKLASSVEVKVGPPATIFSSVVEVRGGTSPSSVPEIKQTPSSVVEIKAGPSSIVEIRGGGSSVLSSKVEVREGTPSVSKVQIEPSSKVEVFEGPSSVVEVRTGPSKILSSHVEIVGDVVTPSVESHQDHQNEVPTILSSVVEVKSSSEEPALSGNNIVEPEYDFLSRQPSEVIDETYRVINLRPSSKFHLKPRQTDYRSKVNIISSHRDDHKATRGDHLHPTGLVTKLGGTVVKEGVTTVHETSVIGTYISGKYAQVLQSTSHIFQPHSNNHHGKPKPTPSSSLRILKTAAPSIGKSRSSVHLEPTPAGSLYDETVALPLEALFSSAPNANLIRSSRRPGGPSLPKNSLHSRFHRGKGRENQDNREQELGEEDDEDEDDFIIVPTNNRKPTSRGGAVKPTQSVRSSFKSASKNAFSNNRFGRVSSTPELATVSVFSDPPHLASATPSGGRRYHQQSSQRRGGFRPSSNTVSEGNGYTRRGYKPRVQTSPVESAQASTSLYKFKLARPPGRWQYKTTPKPRINIRKQADDDSPLYDNATLTATLTTQQPHPQFNPEIRSRSDDDQEPTGSDAGVASVNNDDSESPVPAAETIKVEISTPADFKDTYYEIATIKSPYTFQVGTLKNTRFITVTSTFEKNLQNTDNPDVISSSTSEPLTENILATAVGPHYDKENNIPIDSSIATLPPIGLAGDAETPPLETLTETFSTTQLLLKTHILPVIRGGSNTTRYTLVQSYHVTRLVTATKTLPPMEVYHFVPSKTLNEFNTRLEEAGSELHLELEFGDENNQDDDDQPAALRALQPDIDLANIGSDFDLSDVDKTRIPEGHIRLKKAQATSPKNAEPPQTPALSPEQVQQLALLRLLNPAAAAAIPQVITTSRPVLKVETVYESHVLPIINGAATSYSTISRPVATVSKTEYEYGTSTLPALPVPQVNPLNPLFPQQQQQFAITSTPVVTQTVVTETNSKVLKLTFGAKTAYTTLLSTTVIPTVLTTYVTGSVPVQATAPAFPGYFPAPYPQFPFVG